MFRCIRSVSGFSGVENGPLNPSQRLWRLGR
jgi:hypothetical protein